MRLAVTASLSLCAALATLVPATLTAQPIAGTVGAAASRKIVVRGPIPATAASPIFSPAALPGTPEYDEMLAAGYVQEEYFLSGTANLYAVGADGRAVVRTSAIPYTTHFVVVRPRDPSRFSGNVQLTNGHPLYGELQWARISRYVLRHGDIYVGLMNGGDGGTRASSTPDAPVAAPLVPRWFDPVRYRSIEWPSDDGIRWDVYSQLASLLKSGNHESPLARLKVQRIYASGWSYLGSFLRSFIDYGFHDRLRDSGGHPIIDGYLIGISSGSVGAGHVPISTADDHPPRPAPSAILAKIDVPIIELQSENEAITDLTPQTPEVDDIVGGHRLWTLGGVTHTDIGRAQSSVARAQAFKKLGKPAPLSPCNLEPSDVPMADVAAAALYDLDQWVRHGTPAPSAAPNPVDPLTKYARKDGVGNALGGVRVPQLAVPLARYGAPTDEARCPTANNYHFLAMKRTPLDRQVLDRLYPGGRAQFLAKFDAVTAALVAKGWLLPVDAQRERTAAQKQSEQAFTR